MPFKLTRQQFYDVLWGAPMVQIRSAFGQSDVMIARTARGGDIPLPGLGYWRKFETGTRPTLTPLPPPHLLSKAKFQFPGALDAEVRSLFQGDPGVTQVDEEPIEVLAERLRKRLGKISISRGAKQLHPAIRKMELRDQKRRWGAPIYASAAGRRVLAIASTLFRTAEELGCRPYARVDGDEFQFDLALGVSGYTLKLRIDPRSQALSLGASDSDDTLGIVTFRDQSDLPLEQQLADIIVTYAALGERWHRKWVEDDRKRQREEEERHRREEEQRRKAADEAAARRAEEERRQAIAAAVEEAKSWRDAQLLREYASTLVGAQGSTPETMEHARRLRLIADDIDPLLKRLNA